jgi:hypothetical protein
MSLTREQILAADDLPRECVKTSRGDVWIRAMTAEERETWEGVVGTTRVRATLVAITACDENGTSLFTMNDVPALMKRPAAFIMPLFEVALRLGQVAAADVDALEGNSGASPSDSSATGSPPT